MLQFLFKLHWLLIALRKLKKIVLHKLLNRRPLRRVFMQTLRDKIPHLIVDYALEKCLLLIVYYFANHFEQLGRRRIRGYQHLKECQAKAVDVKLCLVLIAALLIS